MNTLKDIDLSPKSGKSYWRNGTRAWQEGFIYFLFMNRFYDRIKRWAWEFSTRPHEFAEGHKLHKSSGGTTSGIISNPDFMHKLGGTVLWFNPGLKNHPESDYGCTAENCRQEDERWSSGEELKAVVDRAHRYDKEPFEDRVLPHPGNHWFYPEHNDDYSNLGIPFPLEEWCYEKRSVSTGLCHADLHNCKGHIRNFKSFRMDNAPEATYLHDLLITIRFYWIRQTGKVGFRVMESNTWRRSHQPILFLPMGLHLRSGKNTYGLANCRVQQRLTTATSNPQLQRPREKTYTTD